MKSSVGDRLSLFLTNPLRCGKRILQGLDLIRTFVKDIF